jgi:hypothetical protein
MVRCKVSGQHNHTLAHALKFSVKTQECPQLGKRRHFSEDIITLDHKEVGLDSLDWFYLARDREEWLAEDL